jgi:outer membrane protein TolC
MNFLDFPLRRCIACLAIVMPWACHAQSPSAVPRSYSFDAAQQRATEQSSGLAAARAGAAASRGTAAALNAGQLPVVSLGAQYMRYQKTIEMALDTLRAQAQAAVDGFLASLPTALPPLPDNVLASVVPDSLRLRVTENIWRPTLTVAWPLYTGGRIEAGQRAAQAGVRQADAETLAVQDTLGLELVLAYFGQQLAAQTLATSSDNLRRFELHLDNARKLEIQGVLSKGQRLQMEVARNAAERQALRAQNEFETAQTMLRRLLREEGPVQPSSPLFVATAPLPALQAYVDDARELSPTLARLRAVRDIAHSGVQAAEAAWRPQVYGFGSYNLNSRHALLPDPDWIVGVGVHFTLSGNIDRSEARGAALARERQATLAVEQSMRDTETMVERSWRGVETARRQFLLLNTNLAAAEESLRVQGLSFREGEAAAAVLIDAQVALSVARTQRAAAAFEYDVALAQLLAAAGRLGDFSQHLAQADLRLALPSAEP